MSGNSVMLILGVVLVVVGAAMIIYAQVIKKKAEAAQTWPVAVGKILSAEVKRHSHHDARTHRTRISYEPVIKYTYSIVGQPYTGSKIAFGSASYDSGRAHNMISTYSPESSVDVHYDPADPNNAVLEVKASGAKMNMIIGIVFAVLGFINIILGIM